MLFFTVSFAFACCYCRRFYLCLLFLSLLLNLFFVADNVNCAFVVVILNVFLFATVVVFVIVGGVFFVAVVIVVVVVFVIVNGVDFELLFKRKNEIIQIMLIVRCENVRQLLLPVMIRNNKNLKEKIYCILRN